MSGEEALVGLPPLVHFPGFAEPSEEEVIKIIIIIIVVIIIIMVENYFFFFNAEIPKNFPDNTIIWFLQGNTCNMEQRLAIATLFIHCHLKHNGSLHFSD